MLVAGVAAPVVYVATVVLGGQLRLGYSHLFHAISELTEAGAPNKALLDVLFGAYGLLSAVAGLGLFFVVKPTGRRSLIVGSLLFLALGLVSAAFALFPMDPRGAPATTAGTLHLVLAGVSSIGTMVVLGLMAVGARREGWRRYAIYSAVSLAVVSVTGGLAAAAAANAHPLMGLAERLTIGGYLQWVAVTSWHFARAGRDQR